ncbi:retropepsin-like aspartic protease family protein [Salipiger sp.]|uniref:retropepsin-like aspartic protease family protein n=1 Tax=Salipiger sp. TaxID=2078585 RepID=UPI003A986FF0
MSGNDYGQLIYLVLLLGVLVVWFFVWNRARIGRKLQYLAAWGLIFLGVIAAVGLWDDIRDTVIPRQAVFTDGSGSGHVEIPRGADGHYYATLLINGKPTIFVVDTGATGMVLSQRDAERVGLSPADITFHSEAQTANGAVATAPVRLDTVEFGPFTDHDVRAYVNGGQMDSSLLGMTYLQRFARVEISGGRMILER